MEEPEHNPQSRNVPSDLVENWIGESRVNGGFRFYGGVSVGLKLEWYDMVQYCTGAMFHGKTT